MKNSISFIVRKAHSGSSITARILNSKKNTINIGEVNNYLKLKNQNKLCSCGETINDCTFWKEMEIQDTLYIHYRDLLKPKNLITKIEQNIAVYSFIFNKYNKSGQPIEIIDNSKHGLRARLLAINLKNTVNVKLLKTKRSKSKIKDSYKKRKDKVGGSILTKRTYLIPFFDFMSYLPAFILNFLSYIYNIKSESVRHEDLASFLNKHKSEFDIQKVSEFEYRINEKDHHAIGGSVSSKNSLLKVSN